MGVDGHWVNDQLLPFLLPCGDVVQLAWVLGSGVLQVHWDGPGVVDVLVLGVGPLLCRAWLYLCLLCLGSCRTHISHSAQCFTPGLLLRRYQQKHSFPECKVEMVVGMPLCVLTVVQFLQVNIAAAAVSGI